MPEIPDSAIEVLEYDVPKCIREYVEMIDGSQDVIGTDSTLSILFDDIDRVQPIIRFEHTEDRWVVKDIEERFTGESWSPDSIETHTIAEDATATDVQELLQFP